MIFKEWTFWKGQSIARFTYEQCQSRTTAGNWKKSPQVLGRCVRNYLVESIKYKSDLEKLIKQGRIDIAMEVDINRYQQRSRVQMIVRDVRAAHV